MKSPILYPAALAVCLTLLSFSTVGHAATGDTSQAATATSKTPAGGATTNASTSTMAPANSTHKHHAMAHHETHAKHKHMATGPSVSNQEDAYRSALKGCVAGTPAQRDGCLDNTIARFGRS